MNVAFKVEVKNKINLISDEIKTNIRFKYMKIKSTIKIKNVITFNKI